MEFSIIVPCYNVEKRVDSFFDMYSSKNYADYEVIFVDDCSLDGTYDKLLLLADRSDRFTVCQTEKNGGPGIARNKGLENAHGKNIIFSDSDDFFCIDILSELSDFIKGYYDFDLIISPFETRRRRSKNITDRYSDIKNGEIIPKTFIAKYDPSPIAKIYKKNIIDEYDIKFPERMTGEDKCFVVNYLIYCEHICKFDNIYYSYIMNPKSITHSYKDMNWNQPTTFDVLQPIYHKYFPEIEEEMFVDSHLLSRAKGMCGAKCKNKAIKKYFENENKRYPDWIKHINLKSQSMYRKMIYKAMFNSNPIMIKLIMRIRDLLY